MIYNSKSRQIHCRHSIVRQLVSIGVIFIDYANLDNNIMDSLIKMLNRELVKKLLRVIGLKPVI